LSTTRTSETFSDNQEIGDPRIRDLQIPPIFDSRDHADSSGSRSTELKNKPSWTSKAYMRTFSSPAMSLDTASDATIRATERGREGTEFDLRSRPARPIDGNRPFDHAC